MKNLMMMMMMMKSFRGTNRLFVEVWRLRRRRNRIHFWVNQLMAHLFFFFRTFSSRQTGSFFKKLFKKKWWWWWNGGANIWNFLQLSLSLLWLAFVLRVTKKKKIYLIKNHMENFPVMLLWNKKKKFWFRSSAWKMNKHPIEYYYYYFFFPENEFHNNCHSFRVRYSFFNFGIFFFFISFVRLE